MKNRSTGAGGILLAVGVGGGFGALARFALSGLTTTWAGEGYPWGTFFVNLSGSMLLGLVVGTLVDRKASGSAKAFLTAGFCGGFTTFSTYDYELITLLSAGQHTAAAAYLVGSVTLCIAGAWAGLALWGVGRG
jgi:fluoride exporter